LLESRQEQEWNRESRGISSDMKRMKIPAQCSTGRGQADGRSPASRCSPATGWSRSGRQAAAGMRTALIAVGCVAVVVADP
jgi:hypothetical protein